MCLAPLAIAHATALKPTPPIEDKLNTNFESV